jgi:CO/xanthine dehydrogenase Mo-binding subunit
MSATKRRIVAAADEATAAKAAALVKVEYEVLKPILDVDEAVDNPVLIHPEEGIHENFPIGFEPKRNIAAAYRMEIGDVEEELKKERCQSRGASGRTQAQCHVALEPHASFSYLDIHGRLVSVTSTQNPWHTRRIVGMTLACR